MSVSRRCIRHNGYYYVSSTVRVASTGHRVLCCTEGTWLIKGQRIRILQYDCGMGFHTLSSVEIREEDVRVTTETICEWCYSQSLGKIRTVSRQYRAC